MRTLLWTSLCLLPALCMAQTANGNSTDTTPPATAAVRIMALQPTQSVTFEGSLEQLQVRLQLSDAQQSAWLRYADSVKAYSNLFFAEPPASAYAAEPAPRQMERMAERLQNRLNAIRAIEQHAKALYLQLNVQQQKTADRYLMASIPVFGNPPASL